MIAAFDLEIDIEGPVLTTGLETPAYGVDSGFARDGENYILPRTLVKGVVRHMLTAFSKTAPDKLDSAKIETWLGRGSGNIYAEDAADRFAPDRGSVRFGDFKLKQSGKAVHITRIAVDAGTGSVERGMLQVLESPAGYGVCATFAGTVTLAAGDVDEIAGWFLKALRLAPAIGSAKGAGFGHILDVRRTAAAAATISCPVANEPAALAGERVGYALAFDEPLLVASQIISGNLFESAEDIPGGAVKGALAALICAVGRMDALGEALDRIIIRQARPVAVKSLTDPPIRPITIPLSIYSLERLEEGELAPPELFDAADPTNDPAEEAAVYPAIVTFARGWKKSSKALGIARTLFGRTARLAHDVRTRTAITTDGLASTSQLFSRIAIAPGDGDNRQVWIGEIERGAATKTTLSRFLR